MRIFHSIDFAVYTRSNNKAIGCFRSRPKDSLWVTSRVDTPKDFSIIWIQCRNPSSLGNMNQAISIIYECRMFSRANIRRNGSLQMSCIPFSSLSLVSGLYFFRPQSPRKNAHSLLRYFGIRGICITSLPAALFCRFAFENRKRPTSPETVRFRGDFGRFCLI